MLGDSDRCCEPGEVSRGEGPTLSLGGSSQGVPLVNAPEQGRGICPGIEVQKISRILSLSKKLCVYLAPPDLSCGSQGHRSAL